MDNRGKLDISFVMQGPLVPGITAQCLMSIRAHFPEATIVLSTWKESNVAGLDYDICVLSEDPGPVPHSNQPEAMQNNVNRQIVSTRNGLRAVQTTYAFKLRTDFAISGRDFLSFWQKYSCPAGEFKLFDQRVLSCCYFARNPRGPIAMPFHPSDIAFFGLTTDLQRLFEIPLMEEVDIYAYNDRGVLINRYVPEQHLFLNCLRGLGKKFKCEHLNDCSDGNILETEKYFAENFAMLEFPQFNLVSFRQGFSIKTNPKSFASCYTHNEWLKLYQTHVSADTKIPEIDPERKYIENQCRRYKVCRIIANFIAMPVRNKVKRHYLRESVVSYLLR